MDDIMVLSWRAHFKNQFLKYFLYMSCAFYFLSGACTLYTWAVYFMSCLVQLWTALVVKKGIWRLLSTYNTYPEYYLTGTLLTLSYLSFTHPVNQFTIIYIMQSGMGGSEHTYWARQTQSWASHHYISAEKMHLYKITVRKTCLNHTNWKIREAESLVCSCTDIRRQRRQNKLKNHFAKKKV